MKKIIFLFSFLCTMGLYAQVSTPQVQPVDADDNFNYFVTGQLGLAYLNNWTQSAGGSIGLGINKRFWLNVFHESLLGEFEGSYPAYTIVNSSSGGYSSAEPTQKGYLKFNQTVTGINFLYCLSNYTSIFRAFIGGGIGVYNGKLTREKIFDIKDTTFNFKETVGFNIQFLNTFRIYKSLGALIAFKFHFVSNDLDKQPGYHVWTKYDYDRHTKTVIYDLDNLDVQKMSFTNFGIQAGLYVEDFLDFIN